MSGLSEAVAYHSLGGDDGAGDHDGGDIPTLGLGAASRPWDGYSVYVRNLNRWQGKSHILHGVNLTLPRGKIYGLLGPSGCGKTTLLKCLLGLLQAHGGMVKIFGQTPGKDGGSIPGKDVGLMPQDLALYDEFSIYQNLSYYAKIFNISTQELNDRAHWLCDFLKLPHPSRRISTLSGGQRRRVSLGISLLQNPKLLLLDEPTVGVDPALRTKIWDYLVKIAANGTAVVITTHYIEEARQADFVGFMREGRILTEGSPNELMERFAKHNLEDVFLHLCGLQAEPSLEAADGDPDDVFEEDEKNKNLQPVSGGVKSSGTIAIPQRGHADSEDQKFLLARMATPNTISDAQRQLAVTTPDVIRMPLVSTGGSLNHEPSSPSMSSLGSRKSSTSSNVGFGGNGSNVGVNAPRPLVRSGSLSQRNKPSKPTKYGYDDDGEDTRPICQKIGTWFQAGAPRMQQVWASLWKNLTRIRLSLAFLMLIFCLPTIQVSLFCLAIGRNPRDLPLGVVNGDIPHKLSAPGEAMEWGGLPFSMNLFHSNKNSYHSVEFVTRQALGLAQPKVEVAAHRETLAIADGSTFSALTKFDILDHALMSYPDGCSFPTIANDTRELALGNEFVSHFDTSEFDLVYSDDYADGKSNVQKGNTWGFVFIPKNYTNNVLTRMHTPTPSQELIDSTTITYFLDMSNQQVEIFIQQGIIDAFSQLIHDWCPNTTSPLQAGTPVYGDKNARFTDFVSPGMIITISFSQAIGLTAIAFSGDQRTGNLDRTWAAGVRASEIMIAQMITQLFVLVGQVGFLLLVGIYGFGLPMVGNVMLVFIVCLLLGMTGMMYGLVIATNTNDEKEALQLALGSFFPALLLSGVIWPIEAVPVPLNYFSYMLPTTWAADAGRSIMSRGWGTDHQQVYMTFIVSSAWLVVFFVFGLRGLKTQK